MQDNRQFIILGFLQQVLFVPHHVILDTGTFLAQLTLAIGAVAVGICRATGIAHLRQAILFVPGVISLIVAAVSASFNGITKFSFE